MDSPCCHTQLFVDPTKAEEDFRELRPLLELWVPAHNSRNCWLVSNRLAQLPSKCIGCISHVMQHFKETRRHGGRDMTFLHECLSVRNVLEEVKYAGTAKI